jgi:hypothetical protein
MRGLCTAVHPRLKVSTNRTPEQVHTDFLNPSGYLGAPSYSIHRSDRENETVTSFVLSMILVAAILVGGLLALLRGRRDPMGSPEVLERAKQRNRELEAEERRENNK